MSSRPKYTNDLPNLPDDCLISDFEIPVLSTSFGKDSVLSKTPHQFISNNTILDLPIEFSNLTIYSQTVKEGDVVQQDLDLMPELEKEDTSIIKMKQILPEEHFTSSVHSISKVPEKKTFHKSPFFTDINDPQIAEQLNYAFNNKVPEGETFLLKKGDPLVSLIIMDSSESLKKGNYLFLPKAQDPNNTIIKCISHDGGKTKQAFSVKKIHPKYAYMYQTGPNEITFGPVSEKLRLTPLPNDDIEKNQFTSSEVIFNDQ